GTRPHAGSGVCRTGPPAGGHLTRRARTASAPGGGLAARVAPSGRTLRPEEAPAADCDPRNRGLRGATDATRVAALAGRSAHGTGAAQAPAGRASLCVAAGDGDVDPTIGAADVGQAGGRAVEPAGHQDGEGAHMDADQGGQFSSDPQYPQLLPGGTAGASRTDAGGDGGAARCQLLDRPTVDPAGAIAVPADLSPGAMDHPLHRPPDVSFPTPP